MRPVPRNFDLSIEPAASGYVARVLDSPAGETPDEPFTLPQPIADIRAIYEELIAGSVDGALPSTGRLALETIGRRLFEAVFDDEVYAAFRRSLDIAAREGRDLRIRMRLEDVPELVDLPWELLYFPARGVYVAADRGTPLVRYMALAEPPAPLAIDLPLRILAASPSPSDLPELEVGEERRRLEKALEAVAAAGQVSLRWSEDGTLAGLSRALDAEAVHVVHYIGHGSWDAAEGTGILHFESGGSDRRSVAVRADQVAAALHGHPSVRLVVLNACEGARNVGADPFAGTSQALVRAGIPAVAAMQFPITDTAAIRFGGALYAALAEGEGVDAAMAAARHDILLDRNDLEWATPALYLRADDARLFDRGAAAPEPVPPPVATISSGETVVRNDSPDGARVDRARPVEPALRPRPVRLPPADFPGLLGREVDLEAVTGALSGGSFEVYGERGIGKSSVLRHLANRLPQTDDLVHLRVAGRTGGDVAQSLFETFYAETEPPLRPTEARLRRYLAPVSAIVELDDLELDADDLDALLDQAPGVRFLIASTDRKLSGAGRSRRLDGLAEEAGVALVASDLGRRLSKADATAAATIARAVRGHPGRILQAIAPARERTETLAAIAARMSAAPGRAAAVPPPPAGVGAAVVGLLGPLEGAALAETHIEALTATSAQQLAALRSQAVVQAHSPRYALVTDAPGTRGGPTDAALYELLPHLAGWAETNRAAPAAIAEEGEGIVAALRWGVRQARWGEVIRLGRAVEDALFVQRRWGQWRTVLGQLERAARELGDTVEEARVHHQIGSRALALGQADVARRELEMALAMREGLGATSAAELSRHNLEVLDAIGTPPDDRRPDRGETRPEGGQPTPPGPGPTPPPVPGPLIAGAIAAGAIALLGVGVAIGVIPPRSSPAGRVELSPTAIAFEATQLGNASEPATVEVRNAGTAAARFSDFLIDPEIQDFDPDSDCPQVLSPGATCSITVVFRPAFVGTREADLIVVNDAPGDAPRIHLTGRGDPPPGLPALEIDPDALDFGDVRIGEGAVTRTFTIVSRGDRPLQLGTFALPEGPFRIVSPNACEGATLERDQPCTFDVAFEPVDAAVALADLTIDSNAEGAPHVVSLRGVGRGEAILTIDPTEVDFGRMRGGDGPPTARVTMSNTGNLPLTIGAIEIPDGRKIFTIASDNCSTNLLVAGASCFVDVVFSPGRFAEYRATLTVPHDAAAEPATVPLRGTFFSDLPNVHGKAAITGNETWDGSAFNVPVDVVLLNDSDVPAGSFKVSAWLRTDAGEEFLIPFAAEGPDIKPEGSYYIFTARDLTRTDEIEIIGTVRIGGFAAGTHVSVFFETDSCAGEEFPAPGCRVNELDETDNRTEPAEIDLDPIIE